MKPYYDDGQVHLWHGDCRDLLRATPDASIDAIVTDPPYELGFMGKGWDSTGIAYDVEMWRECLRVLKPGGHMLSFGGTRTWHRMVCAVEDAGFEIRDTITWHYGSGFPKSLDVGKAIDRAAGAEREVIGEHRRHGGGSASSGSMSGDLGTASVLPLTAPATDAARQWQGWGTALKPASEPIVVARKPLTGTVAANVIEHGTGAINVDACRVATSEALHTSTVPNNMRGGKYGSGHRPDGDQEPFVQHDAGRWPSNVVLVHAEACGPDGSTPCVPGCPVAELDEQSGTLTSGANPTRRGADKFRDSYGEFAGQAECVAARGADSGGASRFFPTFRYEAKAPTSERPRQDDVAHATVKPLALMRWLVRIVTPPGGTVLDHFAGSGTTGEACQAEGFNCILVEKETAHLPLIVQRLTKRTDPVRHIADKGEDLGLLAFLDEVS